MVLVTSLGTTHCFGKRAGDNATNIYCNRNITNSRIGGWHSDDTRGPYKELVFYENPTGGLGYRRTGHKITDLRGHTYQRVENGGNPRTFSVPDGAIIKEMLVRSGEDIDYIKFTFDVPLSTE